jgi:hypothetical protein
LNGRPIFDIQCLLTSARATLDVKALYHRPFREGFRMKRPDRVASVSAKNAILIVEYARNLAARGSNAIDAVVEAARLRLRPIVMTSLAFILGVTPLAIATGAGSAAQNAIGIGVMGGMISATLLGVFFVPLFFVSITWLTTKWSGRGEDQGRPHITAA